MVIITFCSSYRTPNFKTTTCRDISFLFQPLWCLVKPTQPSLAIHFRRTECRKLKGIRVLRSSTKIKITCLIISNLNLII